MNDILSELLCVSVLLLDLIPKSTQLFLMNLSVVLHLFLQGSLQTRDRFLFTVPQSHHV